MSSRIGRSSSFARRNASSPQGYQSTGWCAAPFRYVDVSFARRLGRVSVIRSTDAPVAYGLFGLRGRNHFRYNSVKPQFWHTNASNWEKTAHTPAYTWPTAKGSPARTLSNLSMPVLPHFGQGLPSFIPTQGGVERKKVGRVLPHS